MDCVLSCYWGTKNTASAISMVIWQLAAANTGHHQPYGVQGWTSGLADHEKCMDPSLSAFINFIISLPHAGSASENPVSARGPRHAHQPQFPLIYGFENSKAPDRWSGLKG